jgi:hypothetical protein
MSGKESRPLLDIAIEREDWELAALCLMWGVVEAARKYPQEALDALLDELELEAGRPRVKHRGSRVRDKRGPHGRV